VVGLILASGRGLRFDATGSREKLLQVLGDGRPVVRAATEAFCLVLPRVLVVVREDSDGIRRALAGLPVEWAENPNAAQGMATSIAQGVLASRDARAWLIGLADMPFVTTQTIRSVAQVAVGNTNAIAAPFYGGERGHPVGFGCGHLEALKALTGDQGARTLLKDGAVELVSVPDSGILRDIDTPQDLEGSR
jgi:molybdenum cofactor cytidylyltransferase